MISLPLSWIEISKSAFEHNVRMYKKCIGDALLAPVVKSNAYGHGLFTIASLAHNNTDINWLCVANLSDAVALREHGWTKELLVLSYLDVDPVYAALHDIHITVYDKDIIQELNTAACVAGKKISVHVEVDTGLGRLGFFPHEVTEVINYIQSLSGLVLAGVSAHFAESYHEQQDFTQQQWRTFNKLLHDLECAHIQVPFRHVANSAGAINVQALRCNLARVGAGVYGMWPSAYTKQRANQKHKVEDLHPVLAWKTRIISIRTLPAGIPIGYDRTHITTRTTKTAVVPIGYFDGYSRRLSNKGVMIIREKAAPVIGRVSMNVTTLDVTDIEGVSVGDEVLVMGGRGQASPCVIAESAGSFNQREMTALLHPSLERIIVL